MKKSGEVNALDGGAIPTVNEDDVVDDAALSCILTTAALVLTHCGSELTVRRLLLIGYEKAMLTHLCDTTLHRRQQLPNGVHTVHSQVMWSAWVCPIDPNEDHIGGSAYKGLQPSSVQAASKIDQVGKWLKSLVPVKQSVPMHLDIGDRSILRGKDLRNSLNFLRQLRHVLGRNECDSKPVPVPPRIGLVDVSEKHANLA